MIKLNVWLTLFDGEVLKGGELVVADPDNQGKLRGQFHYHSNFLNHKSAFALDPLHLPLSFQIFEAARPHSGVHGVFEDSLPDDWGRKLLIRSHGLERNKQRVPQLLQLLGGTGLGAIGYSTENSPKPQNTILDQCHLEELQRLATQFEENPGTVDNEMTLLFQAGSSPGGARPKALVKDQHGSYLAKFGSIRDQFNVVALETATMELARQAGIETAATQCVSCGTKEVLLVKRFDLNDHGGRNHIVSMQTFLKADGYYNAGYRDMAQVIRHVSGNPGADLLKLFKQLVFNVMIGNTDDHLKNFCMLYDGNDWRLSPAFDLLPNTGFNREHVLHIDFSYLPPDPDRLFQEAIHFGIKKRQKVEEIIYSMLKTVSCWQEVFRRWNVPENDIERLSNDIETRLDHLKKEI